MIIMRYIIVILGLANIIRMGIYLIGSDAYTLKLLNRKRLSKRTYYRPKVSILVPAHNEASVIELTLRTLCEIDYPKSKTEIIVINDGSTDKTAQKVRNFIRLNKSGFTIRLINQQGAGKAEALNNALKKHARGQIVMCLDADSQIEKTAVKNAVQHFRNRRTAAVASNVNIIEDGTILGLVQRFEYVISYQMKKAQTTLNTEYIIGGIGSFFRRKMLENVQYYDSNTMTEDIDLTMKIISRGNRKHRLVYASDCVAYTQAVPSFKSLIRQRYRWKYGRLQTFLKNPSIFFNTDKKYAKQLTCLIIPLALIQEVQFIFEPLFVGFIYYVSIRYHDPLTLILAASILTTYVTLNIWASENLKVSERIRLTLYAPAMYLLLYLLSIVEYVALARTIIGLHKLKESISGQGVSWQSPERNTAIEGAK